MAFITAALIGAGASLAGGLLASNAASSAAKTQSQSADKATALQREQWQKNLELQKPFYEAGVTGQNALMDYLGLSGNTSAANYGQGMKPFTPGDLTNEPGYQFRLSQGLKSLDQTAAARGGLLSGNALRGAEQYGQGLASDEYQNAYNRYWNTRNQTLNPLQSLLGQGQTTASNLGTAGQNYATNAGNTIQAAGQARASGYVGGANALNQALGSAVSPYMNYNMMSAMNNMQNPSTFDTAAYYANGAPLPPVRPSGL
jgi:hypothetical protein